jgi:hypothetical protein
MAHMEGFEVVADRLRVIGHEVQDNHHPSSPSEDGWHNTSFLLFTFVVCIKISRQHPAAAFTLSTASAINAIRGGLLVP